MMAEDVRVIVARQGKHIAKDAGYNGSDKTRQQRKRDGVFQGFITPVIRQGIEKNRQQQEADGQVNDKGMEPSQESKDRQQVDREYR